MPKATSSLRGTKQSSDGDNTTNQESRQPQGSGLRNASCVSVFDQTLRVCLNTAPAVFMPRSARNDAVALVIVMRGERLLPSVNFMAAILFFYNGLSLYPHKSQSNLKLRFQRDLALTFFCFAGADIK
jgi:hypothetical protein